MTSPWVPPPSAGYEGWPQQLPAGASRPASGVASWPAFGGSPYDPFPVSQREDYQLRKDLPLALLIVIALAVAGAIAGFVWHATSASPRVIEGAGGTLQLPAQNDKNYFGAEASFFAVAVAAGLLTGAAVWPAARSRGPVIPVALAAGSVAAGFVMRAVGEAQVTNETLARNCGRDPRFEGVCSIYDGHLELRVVGLTIVWAIGALAVLTALHAIAFRIARRAALREQASVLPQWQPPTPPWQPPPPPWQSAPPAWPPPAGS